MMKKLVLAVLMMFCITASAYAAKNDVRFGAEIPPIVKGQCSQAGAISLTFDNGTVFGPDTTTVVGRLTPGVVLCKNINLYVTLAADNAGALKAAGVVQGKFSNDPGATFQVVGVNGEGEVRIIPLVGNFTASGGKDEEMKFVLFDGKNATGELIDGSKVGWDSGTGTFTGTPVDAAAILNSLCVRTPADTTDPYVELNLESDPKVYNFQPPNQRIAILGTFSISEVPAKKVLTTMLSSATSQGGSSAPTNCDRSYEDGTGGFCNAPVYDVGLAGHFALQTGKTLSAGTYTLNLEITVNGASGDNGAYFGALPQGVQLTNNLAALTQPFAATGAYTVTGRYLGNDSSTTAAPVLGCTRNANEKIVRIAGNVVLSATDVANKTFVRFNVPTVSVPGVKAGDTIALKATLTQGACRQVWSGERTLFTVVDDCGTVPTSGKVTFPYFAGTEGGYWNGIALVNPTNAPVDAVLSIVEQGGKKGSLTMTIPAQGMVVEQVENLAKKAGFTGDAGMGAARCYIEVGGAGAGSLKGFAMMGNGAESVGYIVP